MTVSQELSPRVPRTYRGTMSTPPVGEASAKANEPKATRPDPRIPTSSRTTAWAQTSAHHARAAANRAAPRTSKRATSPQATMPSPRRTQEIPGTGKAAIRSPGSGIASVLITHGSRPRAASTLTPQA